MDESIKAALNESMKDQNSQNDNVTDEEKILSIINSEEIFKNGVDKATKWFSSKYGCSRGEALMTVDAIVKKNNIQIPKSKSGCVVTILVAVTATLLSFYFI